MILTFCSGESMRLRKSRYLGSPYFTFGRVVGLNTRYVMLDPLGIPLKYVKDHLHISSASCNDLLTFISVYHSFLFDDK